MTITMNLFLFSNIYYYENEFRLVANQYVNLPNQQNIRGSVRTMRKINTCNVCKKTNKTRLKMKLVMFYVQIQNNFSIRLYIQSTKLYRCKIFTDKTFTVSRSDLKLTINFESKNNNMVVQNTERGKEKENM